MKLLSLTIITLIFIPSTGYKNLTWNDFKGVPEMAEVRKGISATTVTEWTIETTIEEGKAYFTVKFRFVPEKSWKWRPIEGVLRHEQTHFAISYLNCRKFQEWLKIHQGCPESEADHIAKAFDEAFAQNQEEQALFDKETNHSIDKNKEIIWENKVNNLLNQQKHKNPGQIGGTNQLNIKWPMALKC